MARSIPEKSLGGTASRLALALGLAAAIASVSQAQQLAGPIQMGTSFDCSRIGQNVPSLVCQTPELRLADLQQMQTYYTLRHALPERQQELRNQFVARIQALVRECSTDDVRLGGSQSACVARELADIQNFWLQQVQQTANPSALEETRQTVAALEEAQRALRLRGFLPADAVLDGVYGSGTRQAISRFQTERGIPANGFLTSATAIALRDMGASSTSGLTVNATRQQNNNIQPIPQIILPAVSAQLQDSRQDPSLDAILRQPQNQINNNNIIMNTPSESSTIYIRRYITVNSILLLTFIMVVSFAFMVSFRMKKLILIKSSLIGAFFVFPLIFERAQNSCHALEIKYLNFVENSIEDKNFVAMAARLIVVAAGRLSDGKVASKFVGERHPDLSPTIICAIYYWILFFNPSNIDIAGGLVDENPGDFSRALTDLRNAARLDPQNTGAGQALSRVERRSENLDAARRRLAAEREAEALSAEQQQANAVSVENTLARLREQAQRQHAGGGSPSVAASLTQGEVRALAEQIGECWSVGAGILRLEDIVVELRVQLDGHGNVRNVVPGDRGVPTDPRSRAVYESARRALLSPQCNPLRVPPDKHRTVMESTFRFNSGGLVR
jgi:hypothetical protein